MRDRERTDDLKKHSIPLQATFAAAEVKDRMADHTARACVAVSPGKGISIRRC